MNFKKMPNPSNKNYNYWVLVTLLCLCVCAHKRTQRYNKVKLIWKNLESNNHDMQLSKYDNAQLQLKIPCRKVDISYVIISKDITILRLVKKKNVSQVWYF